MRHVIVCECGTIVRGDDTHELLGDARGHMRANHPAIAEQITDEQLLALSQEEPTPAVVSRAEVQPDA
jgi:predicted small metal-binding protein